MPKFLFFLKCLDYIIDVANMSFWFVKKSYKLLMQKITKMKHFENGQNVMFPLSLLLICSLWILIYVMPSVKNPLDVSKCKIVFLVSF